QVAAGPCQLGAVVQRQGQLAMVRPLLEDGEALLERGLRPVQPAPGERVRGEDAQREGQVLRRPRAPVQRRGLLQQRGGTAVARSASPSRTARTTPAWSAIALTSGETAASERRPSSSQRTPSRL